MSDPKYDPLKLENQLCFPLYACSKEVIRKYRPYLESFDLTYTQYITMMVIWEQKKINVKELGKKLYLDSGTLTPVLKSLESKGYITRRRCQNDERVLYAKITPEGEQLRDQMLHIPHELSGCVKLTPDEALTFYHLLYKVLNGLHDEN